MKKQAVIIAILLILIIILTLISIDIASAVSPYYVKDPSLCLEDDQTNFAGQSCHPLNLCGYISSSGNNIAQCYNTSLISIPSTYNAGYQTQVSSTAGYVLDCYDSSGTCINKWYCGTSATCNTNHKVTVCNSTTITHCGTCQTDYYDCDANPANCEIHTGDSCTIGGVAGTYSGCTCVATPVHFITGIDALYNTTNPLLWGTQKGAGFLGNLTNSTGSSLLIDKSACLVFADGTTQCSALNATINLTGYVPYIGATNNVNLGIYNLTSDGLRVGNSENYTYIGKNNATFYDGNAVNVIGQKLNGNPFPLTIDSSLVILRPDDNPSMGLSEVSGTKYASLMTYYGQAGSVDYGIKDTVFGVINYTSNNYFNDAIYHFIGNIKISNNFTVNNTLFNIDANKGYIWSGNEYNDGGQTNITFFVNSTNPENGVSIAGMNGIGIGVYGISNDNVGIYGESTNSYGIAGISVTNYGVYGNGPGGVAGVSTSKFGIIGTYDGSSITAGGVQGINNNATGYALYASQENATGYALYATGGKSLIDKKLDITGNLNVTGNITGSNIYGSLYNFSDGGWNIGIATTAVYYNLTITTSGELNGFRVIQPIANEGTKLQALMGGYYAVDAVLTGEYAGGTYGLGAVTNGADPEILGRCYTRTNSNAEMAIPITCFKRLNAGDNVTLVIDDEANPVHDVKIHNINLRIFRIGN